METQLMTGNHDSGTFGGRWKIESSQGCLWRSASAQQIPWTPGYHHHHDDCPFDEIRDDEMSVHTEQFGPQTSLEHQTLLERATTVVTESLNALNNCGAKEDVCHSSDRNAMSSRQTWTTTTTKYDTDMSSVTLSSTTKKVSEGQHADWERATGAVCVPGLALFAQEMADTSITHFLGEQKICLHCQEMVFSKNATLRVHPYEDVKLQIAFLHPSCRQERETIERWNLAVLAEIEYLRASMKRRKNQRKNTVEEKSGTVRTFYA
jgi:hypothetical protein